MVLAAPFALVRRLLGPAGAADPASPLDERQRGRAVRIGWMIRTAARRTPWRSDCYPQALAARILLRAARVPHTVTFGVRRDDAGELRAHAWVTSGEVTVTGETDQRWAGVAAFGWTP